MRSGQRLHRRPHLPECHSFRRRSGRSGAYQRYAFEIFNVFSVIVFTVEYVLRVWSSVEIPNAEPAAALARPAQNWRHIPS